MTYSNLIYNRNCTAFGTSLIWSSR